MTPPLDIVVLTGFLGSGKTTLLRDVLTRPGMAGTAVIVNEAGEIGLDGAILREGNGGLSMAMLANGCICCNAGSDLADTIHALLAAERPGAAEPLQRIILETSGLSKPGPILRQLASLGNLRARVSVLATFDALRGTDVAEFAEAAAQWAAAHRIVATRMDLIAARQQDLIADMIAGINPLAEIVAIGDRESAVTRAFAPLVPLAAMPEPPSMPDAAAHPRIAVHLARPIRTPAYEELAIWLDNMAGALGDRLLRLKGLIGIQEGGPKLLLQSVGTMFSDPRPFGPADAAEPCFLVLITRDISEAELNEIAPGGLFRVTRWNAPTAFARDRRPRLLRAG